MIIASLHFSNPDCVMFLYLVKVFDSWITRAQNFDGGYKCLTSAVFQPKLKQGL